MVKSYRWKVQLAEQARDARVEVIADTEGVSLEQARKIRDLEEELAATPKKLAQLAVENELLGELVKKNRSELTVREKIEFVRRHQNRIDSVKRACQVIGLSSSTFYYQPTLAREEREKQDADLRDRVELVQTEHPRSGYRTMLRYLARSGIRVGERKLRRVMKKYDLHARIKRAFVATTDSNHSHRVYPNLLPGRTVMGLDEVWTADLTYIRIGNGFVYLAIVLDLYSRRVIGWHVSKQIDGDLAVAALQMAIDRRKPKPGCIHHSDRGVQYLCGDYVALLEKHGVWISNSAKGNPYGNLTPSELEERVRKDPSNPDNRRFDLLL